jgi:phosphonate transport system substrate-binding protein
MIDRRTLATAALVAVFTAGLQPAVAADWRKDYPTVNISVISSENQADLVARHAKFVGYLERQLGVKVKLTTASDYAGTIEAMRAKKAEMAYFGPASYAKAYEVTGGNVEPFAVTTDDVGNAMYSSVMVVRSDSPYKTMNDLKGKTLAFADPNSTSGYQVPNFYLRQSGIVPDQFFGKTGFAGSHENGVLAVVNGTYDAAVTWYRNEARSNFARMEGKGMVPKGALRVIWESPKLPESPYTLLKSLPEAMKADIKRVVLALPDKDPEAWKALTDGKAKGLAPVTHDNYVDILKLIKENERLRRSS